MVSFELIFEQAGNPKHTQLTMAVGAGARGGASRHLLHHIQAGGGGTAAMHLIGLLLREKFTKQLSN